MKKEELENKLEKLKTVVILLQDCYTDKNEQVISRIGNKLAMEIEYLCDELSLDFSEEIDGLY